MKRMMVLVMTLTLAASPCFYKTVKAEEIKEENMDSLERKPEDTSKELPAENEASEKYKKRKLTQTIQKKHKKRYQKMML